MKKKYHFSEKGDRTCNEVVGIRSGRKVLCGKKLKRRVEEIKAAHNYTKCFVHYTARKRRNVRATV